VRSGFSFPAEVRYFALPPLHELSIVSSTPLRAGR
jgi:hypothetical protein